MLFKTSLLFSLFVAAVQASNVLELDPSNFDEHVGKGKPALVEFFAPWCGHCKNLAPTYEQLADAFAHAKDKVVIAKVDADGAGKSLGQKYGVTGFPTLKWFGPQGGDPETYEGQRDLDTLAGYVSKNSGVKSNIKPPPPGATLILDVHTFDEVALDPKKDVLVTFTAPWCGHCKRLKPTYEQVAQTFLPETDCVLANVDADAKVNKPLAEKYGVGSYPTIIFFPKDNKEGEAYEGGRSEEDLVDFLNERCGTQRAVGGGLNDEAGRIEQLDDYASDFFKAGAELRQEIFREASKIANESGSHYIRIMKKVLDTSDEYIKKESERLSSILKKRNLSPQKLDEIKVKANILASFAEKKIEEFIEEAEEILESVTKKAKEEL